MDSQQNPSKTAPKGNAQKWLAAALVLIAVGVVGYFAMGSKSNGQTRRSTLTEDQIPFDGKAALQWIERVCALGPRVSGTEGMQKQQAMLVEHFEKLGGKVELQKFAPRHPLNGERVPMANLIVRWHPERKQRILFCAHYDTRPFPDQDPVDPKGVFLGANDGGSGVGVLAVLGEHMPNFNSKLGVDFVLFDGEELVYSRRDRYFLGSEFFARQYAGDRDRNFQYKAAVLLDMVGDKYLDLYQERNGAIRWKDSRWIVKTIWKKANDLGVVEFVNRPWNKEILDDHIMLHEHGGIPACDIIDFAYRSRDRRTDYWHTREDTPDKCSSLSLAKVGWVLHEWLKDQGKQTK